MKLAGSTSLAMGVSTRVWALCGLLLCVELCAWSFTPVMAGGGIAIKWDYSNGPNGPANWGSLSPDWALCNTGRMQSPLAVTDNIVEMTDRLKGLDVKYSGERVRTNISNNGHTIQLDLPEGWAVLKIKGVKYYSLQMHFHYPSEHTILGESFPLELHMVFQSRAKKARAKKAAVIAFLFVPGDDSPFLAQFFHRLPKYVEHSKTTYLLPPIKLLSTKSTYGRYKGSLTTPPCSEHVVWTVMTNYITVSEGQMRQLKAALTHPNARPTFPSNGRKFYLSYGGGAAMLS